MTSRLHRSLPLVAALTFAAVSSSLVTSVAGAAPATAAADAPAARPTSALAGGDIVDIGVSGSTMLLGTRAAGSAQVADPSQVLLTVPDEEEHASAIDASAITAGLPTGSTAGTVTVTLSSATTPSDGGVQARDDAGAVVLGSGAGDPDSTTVAAGSSRTDKWLFSVPGQYRLTFTATAAVTDTSGTTTTWTAPSTTYTVQVGGPTATTTVLTADSVQVPSGGTAVLSAAVTSTEAAGDVEFFDDQRSLGSAAVTDGTSTLTATGLTDAKHTITAHFTPSAPEEYTPSVSDPVTVRVGASTQVTVLSAGSLSFTPKLSADGDLSACTQAQSCYPTGSTAGLLDKTGYDTDFASESLEAQHWYAADDVVIHVPQRSDGTYTLPRDENGNVDELVEGTTQYAWEYLTNPAPDNLLLGGNLGKDPKNLNKPYGKSILSGAGHLYTLDAVTQTPDGGVVTARLDSNIAAPTGPAAWDSSRAASDWTPITSGGSFGGDENVPWSWSFTRPGVYCLAITESPMLKATDTQPARTIDATGTFTIVVGDTVDPATVTPCAQWADDGSDGNDGSGEDNHPATVITDTAHHDIRLYRSENQLSFGLDAGLRTPLKDLVWGNTPAPATVQTPTNTLDATAVGPVGTKYWYFPSSDIAGTPWPGISTESLTASDFRSPITYRFLGFSLNGQANPDGVNVAMLTDMTSSSRQASLFNTRLGYPSAFQAPVNTHFHPYWTFTAEGVYCIAVEATAQLQDGSWASGSGQITFAVGDSVDPSTVTPCERNGQAAPIAATRNTASAPTASGVYLANDDESIDLSLQDGALHAIGSTAASVNTAPTYRKPDDVILPTSTYNQQQQAWRYEGTHTTGFSFDSTGLAPALLKNGITTISMGTVDGPGTVTTLNTADTGLNSSLSSAEGGNRSFELVGQSTTGNGGGAFWWYFSKAGVYCVPITVGTTLANDTPTATSFTLTFIAGNTSDASAADYVDTSKVTSCADGQHGQAAHQPGGGTGDDGDGTTPVGHDDIYVPNESLTDSGAVILNDGHVDIASKASGDTLETWVKDTTESNDPRYHPLTGSNSLTSSDRSSADNGNGTVFQVLPDAKASVPDGDAYAFLGKPGSMIWQVSQTQQAGLLWPGWSTEEIPSAATQTGFQWTLDKMSGPGEFALYETELASTDVFFNSRDGITSADSVVIPKNAHVHGSWAFSAEGTYCLAFTRSTTMADGKKATDDFTLAVAVGQVAVKKVDPGKCFNGAGKPDTQDITPVPEAQLTSVTLGGVQVLDSEAGFNPGQLVTALVGKSHAGQWVSVWLHSQPTWLGWAQVDAAGDAQVRLPVDAALGSHKIVVKTQAGELIGWDSLALVKAPDDGSGNDNGGGSGGDGSGDGGGSTSPTCTAGDTTIISSGHLDYSTQVVNGKIESYIGDNSSGIEVFREPSKTVLWLKPSSKVTLPAGYEQVGPAGSNVFMVPQTQNMDLIWLGWSTETLNSSKVSSPVTWKLTDVDGPGSMKVFLDGQFGGIQSLVFDGTGCYDIRTGVHAHANWAFSKAGIYKLHFTQSATLANGQPSSDSEVVTIVVGDVDPATAVAGGKDCVGDNIGGNGTATGDNGTGAGTGSSDGQGASGAGANQAAAQCTATNVAVISAGHLDWNTQVIGGKLESLIGDDSTGTRLYRNPASTVLWLKPASAVSLPAGFTPIGSPGSTMWQVPQTQNYDLIWLGWSTELLNAGNASSPVSWSLTSVDGPGTVKVYTVGTFGNLQEMVFDGTGTHTIPLGSHVHANWAFSAQGVYRLHFTQTATLANGQRSSDSEVLTIAVGDVDPSKALSTGTGCGSISNAVLTGNKTQEQAKQAAEQAQADAAQAQAGILPGDGTSTTATGGGALDPITALQHGNPVPLLLGVLGALLLLGAAGTGVLWWRRRTGTGSQPVR